MPNEQQSKPSLPDGSLEIVELESLTDEDADYLASWLAESFSQSDAFAYLVTGQSYAKDPSLHVLFYRALLDRHLANGAAVTNKTRTAFRVMLEPGQRVRSLDVDWVSPKDENWNRLVERCGGKDAIKERCRITFAAADEQYRALYGEDEGLSQYRTQMFAVKREYQRQGIGRVLHKYIADKAKAAGKICIFTSMERSVPAYLRFGCRIVGEKIPSTVPPEGLALYPPGNEYVRVLEA